MAGLLFWSTLDGRGVNNKVVTAASVETSCKTTCQIVVELRYDGLKVVVKR